MKSQVEKLNYRIRGVAFILALSLVIFIGGTAFAQSKIAFEPNDNLDQIREKIKLNNYNFTVKDTWVYRLSPQEKARMFKKRVAPPMNQRKIVPNTDDLLRAVANTKAAAASFDWRSYNGHSYIGAVRNQGKLGSCYAFAACAAAESTYNFKNGLYDGNCVDFSESYIAWTLGSVTPYSVHFGGGDGADYEYYELYALTLPGAATGIEGVCSEANFPYTTSQPSQTIIDASKNFPRVTFKSWGRVYPKVFADTTEQIKTAISTYGTVDVAVWVDNAFEAYDGGVYEDTNTTPDDDTYYYTTTNHAVALVGWDDANGCWILRNSWGTTDWGEEGYMRIKYFCAAVNTAAAYLEASAASGVAPTVTTQAVSTIDTTTATGNGNVTSLGVPNPTAYGVCWNTTGTPTISNSNTNSGAKSATGAFTGSMTGLSSGTKYYVRAYATNTSGTAYGEQVNFTTISTAKAITSFKILGNGTVNEEAKTVAVTVPYGTNVTSLAPTISVSTFATVSPLSGVANDFTSPQTYTVTAQNSSTQNYTVTVSITPISTAKAITSFKILWNGTVNEEDKTVAVTVPYGTNVTSLVPTISVSTFAAVSPLSGAANDFTSPQTYTVTAQNSSTQDYTVTVTVALPSSIATITSATYAVSTVGGGYETITNVPLGTSKATFLAALSKGQADQTWDASGIANPVMTGNTLVVTAQDGTTAVTYTVTVTLPVITASAGVHGSITPVGAVSVAYNGTQAFTITPDTYYYIADVLVDGSSVGAATSYTFSNVTANHTIAATFAVDATPYSISGTVSGDIQEGVTITLSGALSSTTLSGADGSYSFTRLAAGIYSVTPKLSGYIFTPFSRDVTISEAERTGIDFTVAAISIYGEILKTSFGASHKESSKKVAGIYTQYSTDKFIVQATIQFPENFDMTTIDENTVFSFDFGLYSFGNTLGKATTRKFNGLKGGSATFIITGDDEIKGKTVTIEKVDIKWDKKKKLTVKITGTPASDSGTNVVDLSGKVDNPLITGTIDTFFLTFNNAGARFDEGYSLAYSGKKKTKTVIKDKGKATEKTFTLVDWSAKGKK